MTRRRIAIPEVIDPADWQIEEGNGSCNLVAKKFHCHAQTTPFNRAVAVHELLHVRFSDRIVPKTNTREELLAVGLFEDIRISWLGMDHGLEDVLSPILEKIDNLPPLFGAMYVEPFGVPLRDPQCLPAYERMLVRRYGRLIMENKHSPSEVAKLAFQFAHELPEAINEDVNIFFDMPARGDAADVVDVDGPMVRESDDGTIGKFLPQFAQAPIIRLKMETKDQRRSTRRTDVGYLLRRPERIVTDRLCFSEPRRPPTIGTVLVDCSGSMSIYNDEITKITKTTNGATIAGYGAQVEDGLLGAIWILSERGKVARAPLPDPIIDNVRWTVYNCCDLPALMWLTKQRRPHIWVSDGRVNGYAGKHNSELDAVCYGVVKRFGIKRLENLEKLAEYLEMKDD